MNFFDCVKREWDITSCFALLCLLYVGVILLFDFLGFHKAIDYSNFDILVTFWFFIVIMLFSLYSIEFIYFIIRNKEKIAERVKDGHYQYENDKEGRKRLE